MKKFYLFTYIFLSIFTFFIFTKNLSANINLVVTPIKYELEAEKGDKITKTAKIINTSNETVKLGIGTANFISDNSSGKPVFLRESGKNKANSNTEIASWISYEDKIYEVQAGKSLEISFDINIPENATPGGHYGAIFFKYLGDSNSGGQIKIKADYGVLLLVNVDGEIIEDISYGGPAMNYKLKPYKNFIEEEKEKIDNCLVDFSKSNSDGNCFSLNDAIKETDKILDKIKGIEKDIFKEESKNTALEKENFNLEFNFPFENKGNSHIKPNGKIIIKDKDGNILKNIGKEFVLNNEGNIIGEKLTDYITINQGGGNVLAGANRDFSEKLEGVYSQTTNESGEVDFLLTNLSEYFSKIESEKKSFLLPWETYGEEKVFKELESFIDIGYKNSKGEDVKFNSTENFKVPYTKKVIMINYYFLLWILVGFLVIMLFLKLFLLVFKRKKHCPNCKKEVKKDMKFCPYCMTELKKGK